MNKWNKVTNSAFLVLKIMYKYLPGLTPNFIYLRIFYIFRLKAYRFSGDGSSSGNLGIESWFSLSLYFYCMLLPFSQLGNLLSCTILIGTNIKGIFLPIFRFYIVSYIVINIYSRYDLTLG